MVQRLARGPFKAEIRVRFPLALPCFHRLTAVLITPDHTFSKTARLAAKVRILRFKIFRHSGMILVFKTTFEVFTRVGPDNSLERLTERSVGLVTDQPSNVYELLVTLFE